jgi:hypothetical protein
LEFYVLRCNDLAIFSPVEDPYEKNNTGLVDPSINLIKIP